MSLTRTSTTKTLPRTDDGDHLDPDVDGGSDE
jgi:hypothetical protein